MSAQDRRRILFAALILAMALPLLVRTPILHAQPHAPEGTGVGQDALPAIVAVGVPTTAPPLAAAVSAGYAYIEPIGTQGGPNHRLNGTLAGSFSPLSWLSAALRFDGRFDRHPSDPMGSDYTIVGDPRLTLRARTSIAPEVHTGLQGTVWFPGREAPSLRLDSMSPEARLLLAWATASTTIAGTAGFLVDRSAATLDDVDHPRLGDLLSSGVSDYDAVLLGIGLARRLGSVTALLEVNQELLVGDGAPGLDVSPLSVAIGARWQAHAGLSLEATIAASPNRRLEDPRAEHVRVLPRVAAQVGLRLALGRPPPQTPVPPPQQARAKSPPTVPPPVQRVAPPPVPRPTTGSLTGHVTDEGGNGIPDVLVEIRLPGEEPRHARSDGRGEFSFEKLPLGEYNLTAKTPGFDAATREFTVSSNEPTSMDVTLFEAVPAGQVRGQVQSFDGKPLRATLVIAPGGITVETASDGTFTVDVPPGQHTVQISAEGYQTQQRRIRVEDRGVTIINADLRRARRL